MQVKRRARWVLAGGMFGLLAGCALDPTGNPTLDVQAIGARTLATVNTPKGPMVLRETRDQQGRQLFQLKFLDTYQLLNFPSGTRLVQFDEVKSIVGASFAIFEKTSASCAHDYTVLIVTPRSVLPFKPRTDCHSDLKFFQRGNDFVAIQYGPRLHHWYIKADNVDINPSIWEGTPDYAFLSSVPGAPIPPGMMPPPKLVDTLPSSYGRSANNTAKAKAPGIRKARPAYIASPAPTLRLLKTIPVTDPSATSRTPAAGIGASTPAKPITVNLGDYE
ncbi:hypothetical protein [Rhodanobacter denitrificans]|uniref:hypothetical protein n=2 Tax=Rhodanobacteraceae TaxID=1775411 RepID=UPI00138AF2A7|nr:hypothetical protein [Rhodanobacter denitrificans]